MSKNIYLKNSIGPKYFNKRIYLKDKITINKIINNIFLSLDENKDVFHSLSNKFNFNFKHSQLKKFKKYKTVILIGMGGSVLGAKALYSFFSTKIKKKFIFFDNLDQLKTKKVKKEINLKNSLFIIISKSGNTLETLINSNLFKDKINNIESENRFIIVPLGIETANGSHANIIIIDNKLKLIERFEPNGINSPREFYFNSELLDQILKNKFNNLIPSYTFISPSEYLPQIGLQILESLETEKCKKIGDPNGYCAVWCIWWVFYKIKYSDIKSKDLIKLLINKIKFNKFKFKDVIRNFGQKITILRDEYLNKYNLDINNWMNNDYDINILNNIEKDILELIR